MWCFKNSPYDSFASVGTFFWSTTSFFSEQRTRFFMLLYNSVCCRLCATYFSSYFSKRMTSPSQIINTCSFTFTQFSRFYHFFQIAVYRKYSINNSKQISSAKRAKNFELAFVYLLSLQAPLRAKNVKRSFVNKLVRKLRPTFRSYRSNTFDEEMYIIANRTTNIVECRRI